jgi:hypothetical protein
MKHRIVLVALLTTCAVLQPRLAHAYIEPGTGGYILQMMVAGLLGATLAFRAFWGRVGGFMARLFAKRRDGSRD